jgi:hypothetical protein
VNDTLDYYQTGLTPDDNFLGTLNELASIPDPIGPGPVTVYRVEDAKSGTYAAKLTSEFFGNDINVFIPGMLGTAKMDAPNIRAILGKPCVNCRPSRFSGYYKYSPINEDSCTALILVSRWNAETKKRDTIGYGSMIEQNPVPGYIKFDIPVTYTGINDPSDSLTILLISSAGFSIYNFMGCDGQIGSSMWVDELILEYPMGIQQSLMPEVAVNCYPNPAKDMLNVDLSKNVKNGILEVFTLQGQAIGKYALNEMRNQIPVYSFTSGTYYYKLTQENSILNTGTFIIQR